MWGWCVSRNNLSFLDLITRKNMPYLVILSNSGRLVVDMWLTCGRLLMEMWSTTSRLSVDQKPTSSRLVVPAFTRHLSPSIPRFWHQSQQNGTQRSKLQAQLHLVIMNYANLSNSITYTHKTIGIAMINSWSYFVGNMQFLRLANPFGTFPANQILDVTEALS